MPYIHLKKVWTPAEAVGWQLYYAPEDRKWYIKRRKKPLQRLGFSRSASDHSEMAEKKKHARK